MSAQILQFKTRKEMILEKVYHALMNDQVYFNLIGEYEIVFKEKL